MKLMVITFDNHFLQCFPYPVYLFEKSEQQRFAFRKFGNSVITQFVRGHEQKLFCLIPQRKLKMKNRWIILLDDLDNFLIALLVKLNDGTKFTWNKHINKFYRFVVETWPDWYRRKEEKLERKIELCLIYIFIHPPKTSVLKCFVCSNFRINNHINLLRFSSMFDSEWVWKHLNESENINNSRWSKVEIVHSSTILEIIHS